MDWCCPSGPPGSSPEASHWESWVGRLGRRCQGLEAQVHFLQAALEPFQRLPGKQAARPLQDSVSEWAPRWGSGCPAVGHCREGRREGVCEPCVSCLPTQASVSTQTRRPLSSPAPGSTSPCPGRGCWCAAAWMDQTARKWHCPGHLVGTGAGCCARWDPPSRTRALATLQEEKGLWARKSPFCLA